MITITGTLSKAWLHRALGVVFDREYYFDPRRRHAVDSRCNDYAARTFPGMGIFYSESNLGRIDYWDKDQVLIGGIQPNMILGLLLGAEFVPADDRDADITSGCLGRGGWASAHADNPGPGEQELGHVGWASAHADNPGAGEQEQHGLKPILPAPEALLNHNLVRLFDQQIESVRKAGLRPIPPFFWDSSGRAVLHGVLTTAQKLCGEAIFMDLLTEPQKCRKRLNWIADAYIALCRHFARVADLPITDVHVGECSCCMVSPALVEEFVVPVTARIGAALGPVRFHSCGTSTHLFPALQRLDRLGSLDLGSETSLAKAREIFGRRLPITIAPAPQTMSAESTGPILDWAQRVLEENAGGPLGYVFHLEPSYHVETIHALMDFVRRQPGFQNTGGLKNG
ncbi:MAG: uroporphyrinogen decarboxylase family protein [Planctomycetes bacterium]|jgi:hypothetical protein|nr:uroporphyrinogen decarboxylase family protein [Planctomycetota bacterium]